MGVERGVLEAVLLAFSFATSPFARAYWDDRQ